MSQRNSGYARRPDEDYPTPEWVAAIIAKRLRRGGIGKVWEPAAANPALVHGLTAAGLEVIATDDDFLRRQATPDSGIDAIVTNPPYGADRRGTLACDFIRHALTLRVRTIAMLLRVDFDSGKTRAGLFRGIPTFAGKIILIDRIKWFPGKKGPSDNHAWFLWDREQRDRPWIAYAGRSDGAAP